MKKILIIIAIIILLPVLGLLLYFLEITYHDFFGYKAEKAALEYLDKKYGEKFKIDETEFGQALGDAMGMYQVTAHPVKQKGISITMDVSEDFQITRDNYKEMKWRNEAREEFLPLVKELFPTYGHMFVNPSFQEEVWEKYTLEDQYQTIFKENLKQSSEFVHLLVFEEESFDKELQLQKIYKLYSFVKDRQVNDFTIEIRFFPQELKKRFYELKNPHQFEGEYYSKVILSCRFSKDQSEKAELQDYKDISQFCGP
ncbi:MULTISPECIES: hypothetical protein [unclassified Bacillus (in: firmicutes)]|uniref:hypothetical protein n=1 Tax=unclassified Bacillus (in: firmicutes) TaxID=185979 RepID=UPI0008E84E24|nr:MULTISPECIES: hypothetical protein [unclassified Bacillus (in: firmicutes)]SFB13832.1 hypothetical protein SAMN02799634_106243 [Bacillus sp. UNCCL13]SFQ89901.1 hypothetical protein SAMN04488577_3576 [Bacillus sp. cl95]